MRVFVKVYVYAVSCRWSVFFLCEGESTSVRLGRAGSLATFSQSLQSFSRSCHPIHVAVSLLCFSCLMFPFHLQHDAFLCVYLALYFHVLWYFSPQPQQNLQKSTFSWSGSCVRQFCDVHWLLFYHYMLQICGLMFYDDVCTGDWQVKHCKSLLAQWTCRIHPHALSCPPFTFASSPTSAFSPL